MEGNGYDNRTALRLTPVGDVAGVALDADGNPLANTSVALACADGYLRSRQTGASGLFQFPRAPAGDCLLVVTIGKEPVRQAVQVESGMLNQAQIRPPSGMDAGIVLSAGIGLVAVLAAIWLLRGKPKEKDSRPLPPKSRAGHVYPPVEAGAGAETRRASGRAKTATAAFPPGTPSARQKDLLATLTSAERDIVQFVMKTAPSAVRTSKVRRALLIPKTSFTRTVLALERKGFLEMKKEGGRSFLRLSAFFAKE
ncbi:Carboxypeptidase regulatory-like domain protein [uncultured archaeon]|nr:Carboxypeptidase regulatory-like domain protein [uncultured archaeon]